MRRLVALATTAALAMVLAISTNATAARPGVEVEIVTELDFSSPPFVGTFEVTQGADVLGCSAGTFVDVQASYEAADPTAILKTLTCTEAAGSFTVLFRPTQAPDRPGDAWGHWTVVRQSTGVFAGLHGRGEFSVEVDPPVGVELFSGRVEVHP